MKKNKFYKEFLLKTQKKILMEEISEAKEMIIFEVLRYFKRLVTIIDVSENAETLDFIFANIQSIKTKISAAECLSILSNEIPEINEFTILFNIIYGFAKLMEGEHYDVSKNKKTMSIE